MIAGILVIAFGAVGFLMIKIPYQETCEQDSRVGRAAVGFFLMSWIAFIIFIITAILAAINEGV